MMRHKKNVFARKITAACLVMAMLAGDVGSPLGTALATESTVESVEESLAADGSQDLDEAGYNEVGYEESAAVDQAEDTQAPSEETQAAATETQAPSEETPDTSVETQAPSEETPSTPEETQAPSENGQTSAETAEGADSQEEYADLSEAEDRESEDGWKASFANAQLIGDWRVDVVTLALTQEGYTERYILSETSGGGAGIRALQPLR